MSHKQFENNQSQASLPDKLKVLPQYLIPQHSLSVIMHKLTRCQWHWFKNLFIKFICWKFKVDLNEAKTADLAAYNSFNAFFTRELKTGVREVVAGDDVLVSPVDGAISQLGDITDGRIIQAKGHDYSIRDLLGGDAELASQFEGGQFATIYLSPRDYHRIHMPLSGQLTKMRYVPGKLFSVNPLTARTVPNLFARNERVVTVFETEFGPLVQVLVGAIFVGSMETVWQGMITPPYGKQIMDWDYTNQSLRFNKGDEMGRFNMGSTVVLLLPKALKNFQPHWQPTMPVKLGQALN